MGNPLPANQDVVAINPPFSGQATVPGVTFVHVSTEENPRTGTQTTYIYEGLYYPIKAQQNACRAFGAFMMALTRIEGGIRFRLSVTYPFDERGGEPQPLLGVYEMDVEMSQPSVFANPVLRGTFYDWQTGTTVSALLPDNYIALVARVCSNFEAGEYSMTTTTLGTPTTDGGWGKAIADIKKGITDPYYQARAIQLFATVCAFKTDTYIEYYTVFKRTLTAALPGQVKASFEGAGMIWTTAEVDIWEDIPSTGFFQLDASMQWLKTRPNVVAGAGQKTQVSYSYTEFKQGNGLLYLPWGSAQLKYASPTDLPPGA